MCEEQINVFRAHLLEEKRQITSQLQNGQNQIQSSEGNQADEADAASQFEELSLTLSGRDTLLERLTEVSNTLNKIDQDDYGFCDTCGIEIIIPRLVANPTSERCIDCQTVADEKNRAYGVAI